MIINYIIIKYNNNDNNNNNRLFIENSYKINFKDDKIKDMLDGTFDKLEKHESKLSNFLNKRSKQGTHVNPGEMSQ